MNQKEREFFNSSYGLDEVIIDRGRERGLTMEVPKEYIHEDFFEATDMSGNQIEKLDYQWKIQGAFAYNQLRGFKTLRIKMKKVKRIRVTREPWIDIGGRALAIFSSVSVVGIVGLSFLFRGDHEKMESVNDQVKAIKEYYAAKSKQVKPESKPENSV